MHGTGTQLGDPIEMGAVAAVLLPKDRPGDAPLLLAAHKASAGHAEAAAGMVGLACATLALENASTPSILHLRSAPLLAHPAVQSAMACNQLKSELATDACNATRLLHLASWFPC